ncbi:hypothetical protein [Isoptericola sediminis]|uniref:DUF2993 family protein n=1 Tax=Isoptericola sediminis TaxID=2733572 RepID=A0A849K5M9_9MICO|nr:hypothetical protein [Isoptericola sediminis]NNU27329.1 hypothetical protein [Isoptericola sediminis]
MDALLPLGTAPRPATDEDLAARLRAALVALAGDRVQNLDDAKVLPVLDGDDIASLDVDLTGVVMGMPTGAQEAPAPWRPEITGREDAVLRRLRIDAHPMVAVDLPVDLTADITGLRFAWLTTADDMVGAELVEPSDDSPVSGNARLAVSHDGLAGTVQGLLAVALSGNGIALNDFDLQVEQAGPRAASLRIEAGIKKSFLSATVTATASASVDDAMVLTVGDVELSSGNPIVGAMLGAVKGRLEAAAGRKVDLGASLPPGVELADVQLEVGEDIVLTALLA